MKAVIAQADAETDRDAVKKRGGEKHRPTEHEERGDGAHMKQHNHGES